MIMPCCKGEVPAPLDGVAKVTCDCGQVFDNPHIIEEWNEMRTTLGKWVVIAREKAVIQAAPGQSSFIFQTIKESVTLTANPPIGYPETWIKCPECGKQSVTRYSDKLHSCPDCNWMGSLAVKEKEEK